MADLAESGGVRPGTTTFVNNTPRGKRKPKAKPAASVKSPAEVAQEFGFKLAFINSDPRLKALFAEFMQYYVSMKGQVAPERFQLMLDQWADETGFTATDIADRKLEAEQPADYEQAVASSVAQARDVAARMGANLSDEDLTAFVKNARRMGLNASQQADALAEYVNAVGGDYAGEAGLMQDELAAWADANGLTLSPGLIDSYVKRVARGDTTLDEIKSDIRKTYMAGSYPAWADRIMAGMDIADIAAPYKSAMAQLLEVDESSISFKDPLLAAGLQATGPDGKPSVMPLYEYQNLIRKDARWQTTDNAYATYANVAQNLLRTFGFA